MALFYHMIYPVFCYNKTVLKILTQHVYFCKWVRPAFLADAQPCFLPSSSASRQVDIVRFFFFFVKTTVYPVTLTFFCCNTSLKKKSHSGIKQRASIPFSWDCRSVATHLAVLTSIIWTRSSRIPVHFKGMLCVSSSSEDNELFGISLFMAAYMNARQLARHTCKSKDFCLFHSTSKVVCMMKFNISGAGTYTLYSTTFHGEGDSNM